MSHLTDEPQPDSTGGAASTPAYIVGIGASAGGLNALESFFHRLQPTTNMAFVVIQHLSPHFKSLMDDLLARYTSMAIHVATHGMEVRSNTIYLIPPNTQMTIAETHLLLSQRSPNTLVDLPVDIFLTSLAQAAGPKAIAVILSGTGTDGSRGIKAIHRAAGLVLVQAPETAQFDGMPRSALATGSCDHVGGPEDLAQLLEDYAQDPNAVKNRQAAAPILDTNGVEFATIFDHLQRAFEIDFSRYKLPTVSRRIQRRMEFLGVQTVLEYALRLAGDPDELQLLYQDLLIGVTCFFRDPDRFNFLSREVLPLLLRESRTGDDLRIWSAGCATGEEAYSLAIAATEAAESVGFSGRISIFATDVHRTSLEVASVGSYDLQRLTNVSPARLSRFFKKESEDRYRVNTEIRRQVVFAPHNLAKDAPFTKLDLVCCRNLLIYLQPELQDRVISLFHFALRTGGMLFLGGSETLGVHGCAFDVFDSEQRFFRKSCDRSLAVTLPAARDARIPTIIAPTRIHDGRTVPIDRQLLHDYDSILARQTPGLIVDENRNVLHYCGEISRFLAPPRGRPGKDVFDIVDGDLQVALYTALPRAEKSGESVGIRNVRLQRAEGELCVDVTVDPIHDSRTRTTHYFVHLSAVRPAVPLLGSADVSVDFEGDTLPRQLVSELKSELRLTKENLQTAIEELQTSNEQLQATNEELLASNEELQSTNEELHSLNEELYTVNMEFERKNNELTQLNLDHEHLLASIHVGVIFLDKNLRIRRFNHFIGDAFKLLPQDVGRPIDHIANHLEDRDAFFEELRRVLANGEKCESEVSTPDGIILLKRIVPFHDDHNSIEGVVITYNDVTRLKNAERAVSDANVELERLVLVRTAELRQEIEARTRTEAALQESLEKYKILFSTLQPMGFLLTDTEGRIREANRYSADLLDVPECELLGRSIDSPQWQWITTGGAPLAPQDIAGTQALRNQVVVHDQEIGLTLPSGGVRWLHVSAAPLRLDNFGVAMTALDVSERKNTHDQLCASERRFRGLFESMQEGFALHEMIYDDHGAPVDYRFLEVNSAFCGMLGSSREGIVGRTMSQLFPAATPLWLDQFSHVVETGVACQFEERAEVFGCYLEVAAYSPAEGQFAAVFQDITARRRLYEEELRRQKLESLGVLAGGIAHDFNNIFTTVIGNLSMAVDEEELPLPLSNLLHATLEGCERASGLSRQLLTFARGSLPVKTRIDVKRLLSDCVRMVSCGSGTQWIWEMEETLFEIEADSGQVTQVFNNILLNAAQSMQDGGAVRISAANLRLDSRINDIGPGNFVQVNIRDEGCGIPQENLKKIFDPFFSTKKAGTGLGLASVHSIVKRHGGAIHVSSTLGKGTCFMVSLPALEPEQATKSAAPGQDSQKQTGRFKILVLDDEQAIRLLLSRILVKLGHQVEVASSGQEAVEKYAEALAAQSRFDLAVLDLTLPGGKGGREVARELIQLDPHAKLVVSSGYSSEELDWRRDGFSAAMPKPYKHESVSKVLREVLGDRLAQTL